MKAPVSLHLLWQIGRQMGWRYLSFRAWYWLQSKTGILKLRFPMRATNRSFIGLQEWRTAEPAFFFDPRNLEIARNPPLECLKYRVEQIGSGRFRYFSNQWYEVHDWHSNPLTGFVYPKYQHWSEVTDFSAIAGDIKYVWEKSRFTFLYDLVRCDHHFSRDQSGPVFRLITDWIDNNPVNCGPNWKCSQEIALRVLNWTFALHYYRFSPTLNQLLLNKILGSIYDQMRHVDANSRFSEIAVRNNHILTEALALYVTGLMFPCFPESPKWRQKGKYLFEREIISQIARDGTYLQFSMNYHRVVVQLLTWGIRLSALNHDHFDRELYMRANASLVFLRACQTDASGELPNYGHNDGALFFPLTECSFRDFRPQMAALANVLGVDLNYQKGGWLEESEWLAGRQCISYLPGQLVPEKLSTFSEGGYYVIRDDQTITFLRCGKYHSRPFQADNNHLDIWIAQRNILRDAGTWLYNTDEEPMRYFSGTRSHNTIVIENFDQMQKQHRFIWTKWIKNAAGKSASCDHEYWIEAEFEGFRHIGKRIVHRRRVVKKMRQLHWIIEDQVLNVPKGMQIRQLWHTDAGFPDDFRITATDENGNLLSAISKRGWYSEVYGERNECDVIVFESCGSIIRTVIERQ